MRKNIADEEKIRLLVRQLSPTKRSELAGYLRLLKKNAEPRTSE